MIELKKVILIIIVISFFSTGMAVYADGRVEIFDIKQEQVIKSTEMNDTIKKEALKLTDGITGMCMRFRPVPGNGYMIGIPIEPGEKSCNKWLNCTIKRLILMIPEKENMILGVFDEKGRVLFFYVKDAARLLKKLRFSLPPPY